MPGYFLLCCTGIDPNDLPKTFSTYNFIINYCREVPVMSSLKCIEMHGPDLTEVEKQICCQSEQFEDFVLQFLDRCFAIVESSSYTQIRQENSKQDHVRSCEDLSVDKLLSETWYGVKVQMIAQWSFKIMIPSFSHY